MSRARAWTALAVLAALGCDANIEGDAPPDRGGPVGSSGASGGPSTTTLGRDAVAVRCEASQLAPPQLRRLTAKELERTLLDVFPALATSGWKGVRLGADPVSPLGFSNDARTLVIATQTAQELLRTAEDVAELLVAGGGLPSLVPCAAEAGAGRACADQLVQSVGARLFRRPVAAAEAGEYGALFDSVAGKSDFATGARWTLVALMQSPHAVYRSELGSGSGTRKLGGYELASQLAYTFGGTAPSPELLQAGERGELADPTTRVAKAKELLATPAGQQQVHQFLAEWSGYGRVASKTKTTVAGFESLRTSMLQETGLFLGEAVVARGGGVRELLTASYTYLDGALSQLYGYGNVTGNDFQLVERPPGWGLGLLAQGSMLAGSAHSDASSPTLRGLVVYEKLLCHQKPAPLAVIPMIDPPSPGSKTTRERYETAHGSKSGCGVCHRFFDPLGFGFEHFDEAGRYRESEQGLTIDATGEVLSYPEATSVFGFDGLDDLATQLAGQEAVADCVSGLAAAYAFAGAGGRTCLAETARAAFARGETGVMDYFAELAAAPSFAERAP